MQGLDTFLSEHISTVSQRAQKLYKNAKEIPWKQPELVISCLEELQLALEELRVAEEELSHQNERLITTQRDLELERQRYQELFEFAPDGYLVTDIHGTLREANQAAGALLHIVPKFLQGKPLITFIVEEQRRSFRALLNQLPKIQRLQEWEVQIQSRNSEILDVALTVETVRDESDQAIALRWLMRDIQARKQSEAQLQQIQLKNLELLEADRLKNQFIATISHELRTPLNTVLGFSQFLVQRFEDHDPKATDMAERIVRSGKHLVALIEDLLNFSCLKANRLTLRPETFNITELALVTGDELRLLAEQKALELRIQIPTSPIPIVGDLVRVRQVMINLLSNAIKFTDAGMVSLEISELRSGRIGIIVTDTGIGIAPENQTQIFQEFWQVNQTITRIHGGTGLGLAITKALVELMQGSITVESQLGEGTIFRVELPRSLQGVIVERSSRILQ